MAFNRMTVGLLNGSEPSRLRPIETEFLLQVATQSQEDFNSFHKVAFYAQARAGQQLRHTGSYYGIGESLTGNLGQISAQLSHIGDDMGELLDVHYEQLEALYAQNEFLHKAFFVTTNLLIAQQNSLDQISQKLSKPYQMQTLELLREADKWLSYGVRTAEPYSTESYSDAFSLLQTAIQNPIGNQDCQVWFKLGILQWKYKRDFAEARKAFHRAARLAEANVEPILAMYLRYEAYMAYLLGDHVSAYDVSRRAVIIKRIPRTVYDLARYAATIDRYEEAEVLLQEAIHGEPILLTAMLSEQDFQDSLVSAVVTALLETGRRDLESVVGTWRDQANEIGIICAEGQMLFEPREYMAKGLEIAEMGMACNDYFLLRYSQEEVVRARNQHWKDAESMIQATLKEQLTCLDEIIAKKNANRLNVQSKQNSVSKEIRNLRNEANQIEDQDSPYYPKDFGIFYKRTALGAFVFGVVVLLYGGATGKSGQFNMPVMVGLIICWGGFALIPLLVVYPFLGVLTLIHNRTKRGVAYRLHKEADLAEEALHRTKVQPLTQIGTQLELQVRNQEQLIDRVETALTKLQAASPG